MIRVRLGEAWRWMLENIRVSKDLERNRNLDQILPKQAHPYTKPTLTDWWFARSYKGWGLLRRMFMLYLVIEMPRFYGMTLLLANHSDYLSFQYLALMGDFFFLLIPSFLNSLYSSLKGLEKWLEPTTESGRIRKFKAPPELFEGLQFSPSTDAVDRKYHEKYFKPTFLTAVHYGFELSYSRTYQLASGLMTLILLWIVWIPYPPQAGSIVPDWYRAYDLSYSFFMLSLLWFLTGVFIWTTATVFLTSVAVAGASVLDFRPEIGLRPQLSPLTRLILMNTAYLAIIVAWSVPYFFVWGKISLGALTYAEALLAASIPIIFLSFMIPTWYLHRAMRKSKDRKSSLLVDEIEALEGNQGYDRKHAHLRRQLMLASSFSTWPVDSASLISVAGTLVLPILTFFASAGAIHLSLLG